MPTPSTKPTSHRPLPAWSIREIGDGGSASSIDPTHALMALWIKVIEVLPTGGRVGAGRRTGRRDPAWSSVVPGRLAAVSSLWTPGGEHPVGDRRDPEGSGGGRSRSGRAPDDVEDDLSEDAEGVDEAALRAQIDEARARVAEVPAEVVVINHAMGLYELAAIHLSAAPPDLTAAALAIDAFACLVEGLGDRLGPDVATLRDALAQIRMAFVQVKQSAEGAAAPAE